MRTVFIETNRTGYSPEQVGRTMTVKELKDWLENFDEDSSIYLSNDDGYSYGYIGVSSFYEKDDEEGDE